MEVKLGLSHYGKNRLRVSRKIPEAMKKELMRLHNCTVHQYYY